MHTLHLADHTPQPIVLRCLVCSREFQERQAAVDARGDPACPHCGSLRLDTVIHRGEGARRFLHRYNQL